MKLLRYFVLLAMMGGMLLYMPSPAVATAATASSSEACEAIQAINPSGKCQSKKSAESSLNKIIRTTLQLLSLVAGVIAVIMIIIGGLKYITSQGDATSAASARNTLLYAIVGIMIVAFAQIIVKFVLNEST